MDIADSLFLYKALSGRRGVPQKNVAEVLRSSRTQSIRLGNLDTNEAWLWPAALDTQDIVSLCLICQMIAPKVVFEIGTLKRYTAYHFALNTPDETRIFTLDLPGDRRLHPSLPITAVDELHIRGRSRQAGYCFERSQEATKITPLSGTARSLILHRIGARSISFSSMGHISYEYARSDTLNAVKCCHPGSVMAWHDYGKVSVPGVSRWVDEFARAASAYSVPAGVSAAKHHREGRRTEAGSEQWAVIRRPAWSPPQFPAPAEVPLPNPQRCEARRGAGGAHPAAAAKGDSLRSSMRASRSRRSGGAEHKARPSSWHFE